MINESGARDYLTAHKWPRGLQDTLVKNLEKIAFRFFICDDSGSMMTNDGHHLITTGLKTPPRLTECSRWSELTETLKFHAGLAKAAAAPTEFRLLNSSPPLLIGTSDDVDRYNTLMKILDGSPNGGTPLCRHIREVCETLRTMEQQLRANGQKACVVIATDGQSSDGDLAEAMRPLKDLPVWVVVRLCTDEEKIVNYWNSVDNQLELEMDVLDDICGEADEVYEMNPWLTYGEPMHRLREFGIPVKEIDLLDESVLSVEQLRLMCAIIFGGNINTYPHPEVDFAAFAAAIHAENNKIPLVWSPKHKTMRPWINLSKVSALYSKHRCIIL